jgi:E3 ubiquitin-protein ligase SIAH1
VGSTTKLLDHFSTTHKWPCITTVKPNVNHEFTISLHDGFNFLLADCSTGNKSKGDTASVHCLLMLTMERQQLARSISVHWIEPHATGASGSQGPTTKEMQCKLCYSLYSFSNNLCKSIGLMDHYQSSKFRVARTNFSSGLPKPDDCFQVVVPNSGVGDGIDIQVKVKLK